MTAQHTPGPWKAHRIEKGPGLPYTPVAAKTLIAKVYSEAFDDFEQSEANARLIAAAPDLLEALKLAHKALEAIADEMTVGERYTNAGQHLLDSLEPSRSAIAKATGQ